MILFNNKTFKLSCRGTNLASRLLVSELLVQNTVRWCDTRPCQLQYNLNLNYLIITIVQLRAEYCESLQEILYFYM